MSFTYLNLQGKLEHVTATAEDIDRQMQRLLQANPRIIPVTRFHSSTKNSFAIILLKMALILHRNS